MSHRISRLKIKYFENKILKSKTTQKSSILFHTYSILNPYIFHTRIHAQSILNPYIIHTNFHTASILHPYLFHAKSILIPRLFHEFLSDTSSVSTESKKLLLSSILCEIWSQFSFISLIPFSFCFTISSNRVTSHWCSFQVVPRLRRPLDYQRFLTIDREHMSFK